MTWFKVDDGLAFHAKAVAAGNPAMGLWVRAGAWCAAQLTDGHVPEHMVTALGKPAQARRLVEVRLWTEHESGDGYQFWQWNQPGRQPSRSAVEADRHAATERQRRAREAAKSRRESHRDSPVTPPEVHPVVTVPPTRPDPTRPEGSNPLPSASPRQLGLVPDADHDTEPPPFEVWYDAYPLHKGRGDAEKAYAQALKKTTADVLLDGARRYALEVAGKDPAYIKHPGPWLRAGRWADESTPTRPRFGISYGDADREGPARAMTGSEWATDTPRSSA